LARVLSTALVLAVLAATAAAFALTESAKLARSPIYATHVFPKVFSPFCAGSCRVGSLGATIDFKLRTRERVSVWLTRDGKRLATVVSGRVFPGGRKIAVFFDGLSEHGTPLPDGSYKPFVKLERSHRTIGLPNTIVLDTKPPAITVEHPVYGIISPDGDGHHDTFRVPYHVNEPAHAVLLVDRKPVVTTYRQPLKGVLVWNGRIGKPPRPAPPGRYALYVSAIDTAGNAAKPYPFAIVQVRYITLARTDLTVRPGARFALRVSTDAPTVRWRMNRGTGVEPRGTLRIRAPRKPGTYTLYVLAGGHAARARVEVR
jgi:hypothetical protein